MDKSTNSTEIRLLTFNIRQGGGRRIEAIVARVLSYQPDIVVLTEYRSSKGPVLAEKLAAHGLLHQATSTPPPGQNGVFVASRLPFTPLQDREPPCPSSRHWLELDFPQFRLGAIYNWVDAENYWPFVDWLLALLTQQSQQRFILAGDLNWLAMEAGGQGEPGPVEDLCEMGYVDAWRRRNPTVRDYSWTNHNGTRTRVDYVFLAKPLAPMLKNAFYDHDGTGTTVSDHDPLIVDLKEKTRMSRVLDNLRRAGRRPADRGARSVG